MSVFRHDHGAGVENGGEDDPCAHHDHTMVFHSCVCTEILFRFWRTSSEWQLFGSCVAIFLAAVLYEAFKYGREAVNTPKVQHGSQEHITKRITRPTPWSGRHAVQTLMHLVQSTFSYMLMLVFMTYNIWLCLSVVGGLTFGFFLFGWRRATLNDNNEHCQ